MVDQVLARVRPVVDQVEATVSPVVDQVLDTVKAAAGIAPIARAISTAGGIAFDALDDVYMLRKLHGVFAAGEMLDWEAPTGGYLLQACFATGAFAANAILHKIGA